MNPSNRMIKVTEHSTLSITWMKAATYSDGLSSYDWELFVDFYAHGNLIYHDKTDSISRHNTAEQLVLYEEKALMRVLSHIKQLNTTLAEVHFMGPKGLLNLASE
jgi:hypothetical protein